MLWKAIRDAVSQGRIHALQLPPDVEHEEFSELILADGVAPITDWGLYDQAAIRLAPDDSDLSPDTITATYADVLSGEIRWEALRDQLYEEVLDTQSKALAGQQIGMLRRFVSEVQIGDIIIGNFQRGLIPGRVTGPARYDLSSPYYEQSSSQALYRPIDWATLNGDWVALAPDTAPAGFGPSRRTFTTITRPEELVEIMRFGEWIGHHCESPGTQQSAVMEHLSEQIDQAFDKQHRDHSDVADETGDLLQGQEVVDYDITRSDAESEPVLHLEFEDGHTLSAPYGLLHVTTPE